MWIISKEGSFAEGDFEFTLPSFTNLFIRTDLLPLIEDMSTRHIQETKRNVGIGLLLFPLLFIVASYTLWGLFIANGAFAFMGQRVSQGILADGGSLRTVYTSIAPIDGFLTNMVFFTHPVATKDFPLGMLFWTNFMAELAPVLAIMVAEEHVSPKRGRFFRSYVLYCAASC